VERMPGGPVTITRPQQVHRPTHRHKKPNRGRLAVGAGVAAAVTGLGVAVAVGAVPSPLSSSDAPLAAATLNRGSVSGTQSVQQASASPVGSYRLAKMPAPTRKASPKPTHTKTTAAPTHAASADHANQNSAAQNSSVLTAQATAEYQTPTGENQKAWSEAILKALGAPLTSANIVSIGYWMQNEAGTPPYGIVGANNPINVSEPGYGGTQIQSEGQGYYLMSYPSVSEGTAAIDAYLNNGSYPQIVSDLKQGIGLMTDSSLSSELSEYSGGGYTTIPDSWGQSQGTPLS
jgi:hypothetical protein